MTISVIIPAYNHASELVRCLQAVRHQTLAPLEVIVVDDCSSDDPRGLVRAADLDEGIVWITHARSMGAPVARNDGFACSRGEAVLFLDADAVLRSDALERLHQALEHATSAAFAYSAFRFGGKVFRSQGFSAEALANGNFIHTSALIRRRAFPGFDPDLKKFQDWDLWLQIAERGGFGVYIPELLMTIGERKTGMSRWIPSWAYREPFRRMPKIRSLVQVYEERRAIVRAKHAGWIERVSNSTRRVQPIESWRAWALLALSFSMLSMIVIGTPWNGVAALGIAVIVGACAVYDPRLAIGWVALELIIGSKGGFLKFGSDGVNDGGVGIRILQFAGALFGTGIWMIRKKIWHQVDRQTVAHAILPWGALLLVIVFGTVRGMLLGRPFVFADANGWGMMLLLIPIVAVQMRYSVNEFGRVIRPVVFAGVVVLTLATLVTLFIFSRDISDQARETVYLWIRQSGLGEITPIASSVYRIFFQSQVYLVIAWLWMLSRAWRDRLPLRWMTWFTWCALSAGILVSFSRSFWMGLVAGGMSLGGMALSMHMSWRDGARLLVRSVSSFIGGAAIVLALVFFPWKMGSPDLSSAFGARFANGEAAASSRWQLLPALQDGIQLHPLLGSGFGATLTYQSADPRVVAKTGGTYMTYAFEWGWLDLWYKIGIGTLVLIGCIGWIGWRARSQGESDRVWVWASLVTLSAIHIFTPYINHPLGIGLLMYLWWISEKKETPPNPVDSRA